MAGGDPKVAEQQSILAEYVYVPFSPSAFHTTSELTASSLFVFLSIPSDIS